MIDKWLIDIVLHISSGRRQMGLLMFQREKNNTNDRYRTTRLNARLLTFSFEVNIKSKNIYSCYYTVRQETFRGMTSLKKIHQEVNND